MSANAVRKSNQTKQIESSSFSAAARLETFPVHGLSYPFKSIGESDRVEDFFV